MRLDLFLKTSRLIKRRTIAQELCDSGRVLLNGRQAKPAKEVRTGDTVTVAFSARILELEVIDLPLKSSKRKLSIEEIYRVKSERRAPREEDAWSKNP